jgi:hypothetical protein
VRWYEKFGFENAMLGTSMHGMSVKWWRWRNKGGELESGKVKLEVGRTEGWTVIEVEIGSTEMEDGR